MNAYFDIHTHNYLSNCCHENTATAESYVNRAAELGLKTLGFANHVWDERVPFPTNDARSEWYRRQSLAFSMQIKTQIPADTRGVRVLVGCETEYCGMFDVLGMSPVGAKQLDYLLVPHSHVHMRDFVMPAPPEYAPVRKDLEDRMVALLGFSPERAQKTAAAIPEAELDPYVRGTRTDFPAYLRKFLLESFQNLMRNESFVAISKMIPVSVAHPFQPVQAARFAPQILAGISDETFGALFTQTAALGVGLEINSHCDYPEMLRLLRIAKECGCKFTLGSDTHTVRDFEVLRKAEPVLAALELTENDIMEFCR